MIWPFLKKTMSSKKEKAEINSRNEKCYTSNYSYAEDNNDPRNCGMCLRNLSRGYSEGDASLVLDSSLLLDSLQHDNFLEKRIPFRETCDTSFGGTHELQQKQVSNCNKR